MGLIRLLSWRRSPIALQRLALASVVANVVIVVTGGAVRLTNSGLGCPTWPSCDKHSLTPTNANAAHGLIEFSNRSLTFVLTIVAVTTLLAAWSQRRSRGLALAAFLVIPAQALVGGITVLTHLNPWIVACHFLVSMGNVAVTLFLWHSVRREPGRAAASPPLRGLSLVIAAMTAAVLALGTVVTGSGPHAGDLQNGRIRRTGLDPGAMAHLHADAVLVLIGLTVGLVFAIRAAGGSQYLAGAARMLLCVELAQGAIGFVQYFTHVPVLLVAAHMLGACLVWLAAIETVIRARRRVSEELTDRVDQDADQRADDGAVHPDELQVPADL